MAAHRYWRVAVHKDASSNSVGCQELVMRTTPGGATVCTGGTAISSGDWNDTHNKNTAFDGSNTGFGWYPSSIGLPHWIGYDFGAGNEKDIVEITYQPYEWFGQIAAPQTFMLEYSDDGTTWWTAGYYKDLTWVDHNEVKTFSVLSGSGAKRYWGLLAQTVNSPSGLTDVPGYSLLCFKMELRTAIGGADVATGGTPLATFSGTYPVANAFDSDSGSYWQSSSADPVRGTLLGYDFGAGNDKTITQVTWGYPSSAVNDSGAPRNYAIVNSTDGTNWGVAWSGIWDAWSAGQTKTTETPAGPPRTIVMVACC